MRLKYNFLVVFITLGFLACDGKIDDDIISSGAKMSDTHKEDEQNLDKKSYEELLEIVGDNREIIFDKDILLIFGKNGCYYCDILKKEIKKNAQISEILKNDFRTYYINTSYSKTHNISGLGDKNAPLKTQEIAYIFSINQTPTLVFLSPSGDVKYMLPGYNPQFGALIKEVKSKNTPMGEYKKINELFREILDSKLDLGATK